MIGAMAQDLLSCPAPFLDFSTCAPQHAGTVLVTGGSSGLGLVAVRMLAQQGLKVVIASKNEVSCTKISQEIYLETGYAPMCIQTDLRDSHQVEALAKRVQTIAPHGLDALILAAACAPDGANVQQKGRPDAAVQI